MRIEFDSAKDAADLAKHGVSLALAAELDWEAALVWVDDRFEYDELRMIALAQRHSILYCVAFVERGEVRRPFSLRRANRREVKRYVQSVQAAVHRDAKCNRRSGHHCRSQDRSRCTTAHAEAIGSDGPDASATGASEVGECEAACVGPL